MAKDYRELVSPVMEKMELLVETLNDIPYPGRLYHSLDDVLQRLRLWSASFATPVEKHDVQASRKVDLRISELLGDLNEDLQELQRLLSLMPSKRDADYSAEMEDISGLVETLGDSVTYLFKTSSLATKRAQPDEYLLALGHVKPSQVPSEKTYLEIFDALFPRSRHDRDDWAYTRLAKANHRRRCYLEYREMKCKTEGIYIPFDLKKRFKCSVISDAAIELGRDDSGALGEGRALVSPSGVSTVPRAIGLDKGRESETSRFPGLPRIQHIDLEDIKNGSNKFLCVFCFDIISCTTQDEWERHIHSDIRAYICLEAECTNLTFDNKESWMQHQCESHLKRWICLYCDDEINFACDDYLKDHIRNEHGEKVLESQIDMICEVSRVKVTRVEDYFIESFDCFWCNAKIEPRWRDPSFTGNEYMDHMAYHMEQSACAIFLVDSESHWRERLREIYLTRENIHNAGQSSVAEPPHNRTWERTNKTGIRYKHEKRVPVEYSFPGVNGGSMSLFWRLSRLSKSRMEEKHTGGRTHLEHEPAVAEQTRSVRERDWADNPILTKATGTGSGGDGTEQSQDFSMSQSLQDDSDLDSDCSWSSTASYGGNLLKYGTGTGLVRLPFRDYWDSFDNTETSRDTFDSKLLTALNTILCGIRGRGIRFSSLKMNEVKYAYLQGARLAEQGRMAKAMESMKTAYRASLRKHGSKSSSTLVFGAAVGILHTRMGEFEAAESIYLKSLETLDASSLTSTDGEAYISLHLAFLYIRLGELQQAESRFRDTLKKFKKAVGDDHWVLAPILSCLGFLEMRRRNFLDAEKLLEQARFNYEQALSYNSARSILCLRSILDLLYLQQGRLYNANETQSGLLPLKRKLES